MLNCVHKFSKIRSHMCINIYINITLRFSREPIQINFGSDFCCLVLFIVCPAYPYVHSVHPRGGSNMYIYRNENIITCIIKQTEHKHIHAHTHTHKRTRHMHVYIMPYGEPIACWKRRIYCYVKTLIRTSFNVSIAIVQTSTTSNLTAAAPND